jgi:hypothetical protein
MMKPANPAEEKRCKRSPSPSRNAINSKPTKTRQFSARRELLDRSPSHPEPVYLAFENYYNPFALGITGIQPWPFQTGRSAGIADVPSGYYAISVNQLYESPWSLRNRDGSFGSIDLRPLGHLRQVEPIGWAGFSIRIFSAVQVRQAYTAPASSPLWSGFNNR